MTLLTEQPEFVEPAAPSPAADPAASPAGDGGQPTDQAQKTEGEQPPTQKADEKSAGAPESYDWKLDDGVQVDESGLGAFADWAKANNLTQDQANSLLNSMATASAVRQQEAHTAAVNEWVTQAKADAEFGGRDLTKNLAVAKAAIDKFGSPELSKLLNESGLGNHPEIIRAFYRAGKAISEDSLVLGNKAPQHAADPAKRMFPNMN